jgi:hypothetical protein
MAFPVAVPTTATPSLPLLPEMTLPSFAPMPPMVLPLELSIRTPPWPFGTPAVSAAFRPMMLSTTRVPVMPFRMRMPTVPFPEITLRNPTPPIRFPVPTPAVSRITPSARFGRASAPVASSPIRFDCTRLLFVPLSTMRTPPWSFPEMTLPPVAFPTMFPVAPWAIATPNWLLLRTALPAWSSPM